MRYRLYSDQLIMSLIHIIPDDLPSGIGPESYYVTEINYRKEGKEEGHSQKTLSS